MTTTNIQRLREFVSQFEADDHKGAAIWAVGFLAVAAFEARRRDLSEVALSEYDPMHVRYPDYDALADRLACFLIELGRTLPPDLLELTTYVQRLCETGER